MSELENEKPITKSDLMNAFAEFHTEYLKPDFENIKTELRQEIKGSEQRTRDYTDKRFNELRGEMNGRFKEINERFEEVKEDIGNIDTKAQKIINILNRNSLLSESEKEGLEMLAR